MIWIAIYYFVHEMQTVRVILESESVRIYNRSMRKVTAAKYSLIVFLIINGIVLGLLHFVDMGSTTELTLEGVFASTRLITDGYIYFLFFRLFQFFGSYTFQKTSTI